MAQNFNVTSELVSIDNIIGSKRIYNIPRYQRLYVWQKEQINTLLFDLYDAFKAQKTHFHLGNVLIVQPDENKNSFDLVDGQQRFTTLWLISLELGGCLHSFTKKNDGNLLLHFAIREDVKQYFENLLDGGKIDIDIDENNEGGSLGRIKDARKEIHNFVETRFKQNQIEKEAFAKFIREKIQLIETSIPKDSNLSKMFEVINNRGVQLQHHDILKSLLLSKIIDQSDRIAYSKIWNACANMDDYLERSITSELGIGNLSDCFDYWQHVFRFNDILGRCKGIKVEEQKSKSLLEILKNGKYKEIVKGDFNYHPDAEDEEFQNVRSILTFPQLLLHALRIYLVNNGTQDIHKINEKELLQIFKENFTDITEKKVKSFIQLLWKVREVFDKYVIKWVELEPKKEELTLKKIFLQNNKYKGKSWYIRRTLDTSNKGKELLQSMLYHSQQNATQYWLTPYLYRLLKDVNDDYTYLKKLDNVLFSLDEKEDKLIQRTRTIMEQNQLNISVDLQILNENLGTSFHRYWFYKLEFVLWHELNSKYDKWKEYRINSKNSIEHISPQTERYKEDTVSETLLHSFGNLALVSRKFNSEMGNASFREKQATFISKRNAGDIESLKLYLVYDNRNWGDKKCVEHFEFVIKILKQYFQKTQ